MLVHQGAIAFQKWTNVVPNVSIMRKALLQSLGSQGAAESSQRAPRELLRSFWGAVTVRITSEHNRKRNQSHARAQAQAQAQSRAQAQ